MTPGDLVTVGIGGHPDDVPGVAEDTHNTVWMERGSPAVFIGPKEGQQILGGSARILWRGRVVLVSEGVLALVQPAQEAV